MVTSIQWPDVNTASGRKGSIMEHRKRVTCPYCGTEQTVTVDTSMARELQWCDTEEVAGCDRPFVTSSELSVDVVVWRVAASPVVASIAEVV